MKTAISTAGFGYETEDAAKTIKSLGAEYAEISFKTFYEYRPEFSKRLAPEISGLNVISVRTFAPNFEYQLFSESRRVRGDGFYWLDQLMRSMQLLGATRYCFQGAPFGKDFNPDQTAAHLREIAAFCSRYGVGVCLENDGVSAPRLYGRIKERCPEISFSLSLSKVRQSYYPLSMFTAELKGSVAQICATAEEAAEPFTAGVLQNCETLVLSGNDEKVARFLKG